MADRVSVSIELGGNLAASDCDRLIEVVNDEGLSVEWDGPAFDASQFPTGEPLRLYANDIAWGRLDELEAFCIEQALGFVCWSGGCVGSFGPQILVFTGDGEVRTLAADDDERPVICRATAERLGDFAAIMAHFNAAEFVVPPLVIGP